MKAVQGVHGERVCTIVTESIKCIMTRTVLLDMKQDNQFGKGD